MKVPSMIAAEVRRLTASPMAVLALVALIAVPVLYGGLYLWANQDPYGRFPDVPVGLVVDDTGATNARSGEWTNFGEEVADTLLDGGAFDWQRMTGEEATQALHEGSVDFVVTLPADFSDALVSVSTDNPRQARIELETNDANNYLASSIGSTTVERIRRSVAEMVGKEAADTMLTALSDIRSSLSDAADGAGQLADGASTAHTGSGDLAEGTGTLADGIRTLAEGASQVAEGARGVRDGNSTLSDKADDVAASLQNATDSLPEIREEISRMLHDSGLTPEEVADVLAQLDPLADTLREGNDAAQNAVGQIDLLADGARQLADGAGDLAAGAETASQGASSAHEGALSLRDGLSQLASGSSDLRDGLADGVEEIPASTAQLRTAQAKTIADPVTISSDKVAAAPDYGAGLAPFFAALAGWIGIYALFLIVKPISRRAVTALHSPVRITLAGWLTPAMFGGVQMVGLLGVLAVALGFTFHNPLASLGIMVLASATYAAIILALNVWLGSVGQFMGLVLMVLQLVTAGGTFPWQTLPAPLTWLHHVLPMGYVVDAMRQVMYGGDLSRVGVDIAVLLAWLAGALVLAMLGVSRMTQRRTLRDLEPSLIG
ncbi:YhgE/Pip family protein [Microbacterium sp. YY-01]|uniref:YhgE/Pip family protein n=1 Tax=Microbacterium sp. YY-01 TaxID=3421634 RepID=UPI003D17D8A7